MKYVHFLQSFVCWLVLDCWQIYFLWEDCINGTGPLLQKQRPAHHQHAPFTCALPALWGPPRCRGGGIRSPTFNYQDPFTRETLICDKCPPGMHMTAYCTSTTPTVCAPCRSRHFTKLWNYLPRCLYCNNYCTENQEVETECTATTNRVCRCKQGFYMTNEFCWTHSKCGPRSGVKTQGETLRTFVSGFFSRQRMRVAKMTLFITSYIHKSEEGVHLSGTTLPKERGPLMDIILTWLAQAPEEQLKTLPLMLKASKFCHMREQLEMVVDKIKQQSPNCTSPFIDVEM
ncbi:Tumor necrosis factor receptor superfamily member 6B [Dissostichus eleginoides]|uniref:Tumor necrosis factor receptor superfamily member 6B n=1 Tax=Dissostichus eleginoides TaxID=100907 RepID=A0AAD9C4R5_DISEL|nr:Tumor necrosis factor receptor superfamily member 6B [Dissostichus eleginoides]